MGMIWAMIWVALSDASGVYICAFASVAFWGAAVGIRTKNFIHSTICRILSKSLKISQILLNTPFFSLIHKHFYMHTHTHTPYTHIRTHIQSIYLSIYLVCIISYHIISYRILLLPLPDLFLFLILLFIRLCAILIYYRHDPDIIRISEAEAGAEGDPSDLIPEGIKIV